MSILKNQLPGETPPVSSKIVGPMVAVVSPDALPLSSLKQLDLRSLEEIMTSNIAPDTKVRVAAAIAYVKNGRSAQLADQSGFHVDPSKASTAISGTAISSAHAPQHAKGSLAQAAEDTAKSVYKSLRKLFPFPFFVPER